MHRIFIYIYYLIRRNRLPAVVAALCFLATAAYFASRIDFDEDINQIIPKNEKSDITAKVLSQLNFSDKIVVIFESTESESNLAGAADAFLEEIEPLKPYISSVEGKIEDENISEAFSFVYDNIPLFLDEEDYAHLEKRLHPDSISTRAENNYRALVSPTALVTKDFIKKDPLGISFTGLEKLNQLNVSSDFILENNYVMTRDGKNLLLFIEPRYGGSETKNNEAFTEALNRIRDDLNAKFRDTEISYFGSPFIAVANAKQIKKDIQSTVAISATVLLFLLIFYFRNFFAPLIIFIPTIFGAAAGLLLLYFVKDKISAISLSVSAILIGITVDYAIHVLTHYKHKSNIEEVFKEITHPVIMSAATTAISFLCLVFVRSEALKDLGIFASVTVMVSAVFTLIIIPHLYHPKAETAGSTPTIIDKVGAYPYEKNKWLVIICSVLIVATFFGFRHIQFNQNIADLNYVPDDMKASEKKLSELSDYTDKSVYVVSYGNTADEALQKNTEITRILKQEKQAQRISSYSSAGQIIQSREDQQKKINRWNAFWTEEKKNRILRDLHRAGTPLGFNDAAFEDFSGMLNKTYSILTPKDYSELKALKLSGFMNESQGLHTVSTLVKLDENHRDTFIKNVEESGGVLAIDRQQLNENFLGLLKDDFGNLINYSLIAVIIIFLLFFRNVDLTLMAVIPIVLSGVVTAGILYFLGLELNIFSTIVCTLIFGAGVDFNIFLTQALQKELTTGKDQLPVYRVSIILALLTTILAIGALVFAKHPALHSVSAVALIGLVAVVIISFAMYPLMFNFIKNRSAKGLTPVTFRIIINSVFSLFIYTFGGIFFGSTGRFIIPEAKGKTLENIKRFIAFYLKTVLYSNPFVRKKLINDVGEKFERPAVIIANHNSSLDTLALALAHHKMVYLVNDWVYQSPVFGKLVQALGFYPVSQGVEGSTELLRKKVEQGYSLMAFPEAERSPDNNIRRFHKGAFYLAEELNLDILPIYIHGNSEVMPKGELFIFDGSITVKVGQRISKDDASFGKNYSEKTKKINSLFRQEFAELRTLLEDENYFRKMLFLSFHYKENEVADAVKRDFEQNKKKYHRLNRYIGKKDTIFHMADNFGQTDVLLTLQEAARTVYSYIRDHEKRAVAGQNYLVKKRKIKYPDSWEIIAETPDVLLISDPGYRPEILSVEVPQIIFMEESFAPDHIEGYQKITDKTGLYIFTIID